jgi:hypothetical protein
LLAALALGVALHSCSSSGGGISGTGLVAGAISEFGSIIVADIEFDTTNAVVTIEGDPATVDDLKLGMFVYVRGRFDRGSMTGIAERVASDHLVLGPVESVGATSFTVLSQTVEADAQTVFDGTSLATLAVGDVVEVFGVADAQRGIRATRVQLPSSTAEFEVTGTVANLDVQAETFEIGALTVDFSNAILEDVPQSGLADGMLVEAETDTAPVGGLMAATGVELHTSPFEEGDAAEIEGLVTAVESADEFVVNATQRVRISDDTRFENGGRADVVLNARVDVEGSIAEDGTLLADEIEFEPN